MAKDGSGKHSRLRRARKDWIKGNRDRAARVDADDESGQLGGRGKMRPRAIAIDEMGDLGALPRGQVMQTVSGRYDVRLEGSDEVLSCNVKRGASTENEQSTLVAIGDFVRVQPLEDRRGLVYHVEQRQSHLGRGASGHRGMEHVIAANVDLLLCIAAADRPDFRRTIIDRYVVAALLGDVTPVIILNKVDTVEGELRDLLYEEISIYEDLGYQTFMISAQTGEGLEDLREAIAGATSVLVGQSGAGKSTITNALLGYSARRTSEVREKDRRGTHTTIDSVMLPLPGEGYLIDTPGLREFGIWDLEPTELDGYFVEFGDYLQKCHYLPCTHTHEPGCAVRAAVEEGYIEEGRYMSYLAIFNSLEQGRHG
jgi:ribosome biogenesis GTPase